MANGDSEFGIITGNLSNRKNVPQKMQRYSEYGGESSGDNSRVTCIWNPFGYFFISISFRLILIWVDRRLRKFCVDISRQSKYGDNI